MRVAYSFSDLLAIVGPAEVRGTTASAVTGLASLETARAGDLSFLGNPRYKTQVPESEATVILLPSDYVGEPRQGQVFVLLANPSVALAAVCARIEQRLWPRPAPGVHPSAVVAPDAVVAASATIGPLCVVESGAQIGERAHLQAQVFVGQGVRIGDECWLQPGVHVSAECTLHARVRLQPGVVVGSDGFGYEFVRGRHEKVPQVGGVIIESDVEIGANSTIDRARFSQTVIGEGTKIDNLVQVAHNVVIGKHCILCAQVGVAGSSTLGDYVILGGQAGVSGHVKIGRGVKAGARAGLTTDLEAGGFVSGMPALPHMLEQRLTILRKRLPELFRRFDALEAAVTELKKSSSA
jgi:UDP-3-O-[3-hydroxymyristoyl] glucosamine N-acyltransferase